ncbi:MAG TPA: PIN domain-containing protein [Flavobacteriaceae bacterium]|nr:PIN domain-containing protein [Flavobacteriaceae bacterium]
MDKILIDTDVLIDFFFDRKPFAEYSTEILNLCANKEIQGFTTPVIISNVYYLLRKTAKHNIIIEKIKQLLTIIDIVEMNKSVVLNALNSEFKGFEDA